MSDEKTYNLAIKFNNCASNDPCAICGARTDPSVGPELFMADSWALVCYACGEKYAPDLMRLLVDHGLLKAITKLVTSDAPLSEIAYAFGPIPVRPTI